MCIKLMCCIILLALHESVFGKLLLIPALFPNIGATFNQFVQSSTSMNEILILQCLFDFIFFFHYIDDLIRRGNAGLLDILCHFLCIVLLP